MESTKRGRGWLTAALLSLLVAACGGGGGSGGSGGSGGDGGAGGGEGLCGGNRPPCPDDQFCDVHDQASCNIDDVDGVCRPRPESCEEDCPGVCGCNDQFYCNACLAQQAGVDVFSTGALCGETNNLCGTDYYPCNGSQYCDYPDEAMCGADHAHGVCLPRPENCQEDCPGVCGCDGQFYCNACIAAAAGVDVDPLASCAPPGSVCGGLGNAPCEEGTYCDWPDSEMCGAADGTGTCQPIPQGCQEDCPGVCGCDGQFYCNACIAAQAGVDVAAGDTSCVPSPGGDCGGLAGGTCGPDEYCDWTDVAYCGFTDQTGTCLPRPEICPQDCPGVCGCDGALYCNACVAAQSGVDVHPNIDCSP